ncbi:hypothetical protein AVEN_21027-1 [Araneus ventricosus]|uniref:Uncharacterized protein n=1 Tax=Araneus ventricosus TaxID=182803 RepID=A0A4Y2D8E2_ARAVE|nr:hypothetical protein AVEN_21027-1 [Araneus ventricosus]
MNACCGEQKQNKRLKLALHWTVSQRVSVVQRCVHAGDDAIPHTVKQQRNKPHQSRCGRYRGKFSVFCGLLNSTPCLEFNVNIIACTMKSHHIGMTFIDGISNVCVLFIELSRLY